MNSTNNKNRFVKKFMRQKKSLSIPFLIIGLAYIISLIFFTKSLLSLVGIESLIRIIILIVLYLIFLIYSIVGILLLFTHKNKSLVFLMIFTTILVPVMSIGSFYIDKTYGILDKVQKKYVNYTSYLVSLEETEEYNKIGMISSKNDSTGYIIPMEMIKKYNIASEIVEYDDYISMMSDLYDKHIDALFVADNYITMFNSYEKFEKIETETKVIYEMSKELENVDNVSYSTKALTEPFTILLMGVDSTGDGIASSSFNGDTLMMISFNPKTLSSTIFSIPRDTFVPIACRNNEENKINSSAYGGTTCVVNTIENLTGIKIDYYVKMNFTGVVKLVDDLGGINVDVPMKFCEQDSERRFGEYLICLDKGYQKLNGEQALALSRHRKTLPLGDFQRVQNQQLVLEAMVQEIKNIRDLESFYTIMEDVVNNIDTNMSTPQILSLYQVGKNILLNKLGTDAKLSIQKTYLTGYDLTMYLPQTRSYTYTFQYYRQSLNDIVTAMKVNLELEEPTLVKTFSFDANKPYSPRVAGKIYYNEPHRELLPNFVGQNKEYVEQWAQARNLELKINEVTEENPLFDKSKSNGQVVSQQEHSGMLVDKLSSLNISVISKTKSENQTVDKNEDKTDNDELLPNFVGSSISDFHKWKNSLSGKNIIINEIELTPDEILELKIDDLKEDIIYKQSVKENTKLDDITTLTVNYYKKIE